MEAEAEDVGAERKVEAEEKAEGEPGEKEKEAEGEEEEGLENEVSEMERKVESEEEADGVVEIEVAEDKGMPSKCIDEADSGGAAPSILSTSNPSGARVERGAREKRGE